MQLSSPEHFSGESSKYTILYAYTCVPLKVFLPTERAVSSFLLLSGEVCFFQFPTLASLAGWLRPVTDRGM